MPYYLKAKEVKWNPGCMEKKSGKVQNTLRFLDENCPGKINMIGVCYSRFGHLHLTRNARYTQNTVLNVLMPSLIHPRGNCGARFMA
jgi:hypothetical protein